MMPEKFRLQTLCATEKRKMEIDRVGNATLYCGNCLELIPGLSMVDAVVADPPYSSGGTTAAERMREPSKKYQQAECRGLYPQFQGDNRDQRGYLAWSTLWMSRCYERLKPGGLVAVFSDWRQLPVTTDAIQCAGFIWRGIGVWDKTRGCRPARGRWRAQAEFFAFGTKGAPLHGPTAPGVFTHSVAAEKKLHMAGKPTILFEEMLAVCGNTILDPFMGSASTGIAALRTGRSYIGIEVDPHWYAVSVARLKKEFGDG